MPVAGAESGSRVAIDRFECRYFAPREHPSPEIAASELNGVFPES